MSGTALWDQDLEGLTWDQLLPLFPEPPHTPHPHTFAHSHSSPVLPSYLPYSPPGGGPKTHTKRNSGTLQTSPTTNAILSPSLNTKPIYRLSQGKNSPSFRASAPGQINMAMQDTIDFITKGCRGELPTSDLPKLHELLLQMSRENVTSTLEKCYDTVAKPIASRNKLMGVVKSFNEETSIIKLSKCVLDFGYPEGRECPLNTAYADEIVLTNIGTGKVKFKVLPIPPATTHLLTVNPRDGIIKKKGTQSLSFNLKLRTTTRLRLVVTIEVEGGTRYFVIVAVQSEKSVFGVAMDELELVDDGDLQVPTVLVTLKEYLYQQKGLHQVGVFRVQGDEAETLRVKNQLNTGTFTGCKDVNCVASLIKLWFRELPMPLLSSVRAETLKQLSDTPKESVDLHNALPEPNKSLMTWLMNLLADALALESVNKMSARNLAICVAPNLYNDANVSPTDALFLSGKVVTLVTHILSHCHALKYPR